MRISDWSSDVCSSDLSGDRGGEGLPGSGATPYDPAKHTLEMRDAVAVVMDNSSKDGPVALPTPLLEVSVRVKVCDATIGAESNCKQYAQGWKPEGLIQEYSKQLRYSIFGYLIDSRSDMRRVGKECGRTFRSRWWT